MSDLELVIRYVGFGKVCHNCGRVRKTTHYILRQGEKHHQELYLCDDCQNDGHVIRFRSLPQRGASKKERRKRVKLSQKLERGLAIDMGGITQPGSGNKDAKGDVRVQGEWRMEHKFTNSVVSFLLKVTDLASIVSHANMAGEWPAMVIEFRKMTRRFVVLPFEVFEQMRRDK